MPWEYDRVAGPFAFTEGPAWDGNGVLFSDIPNSRILRYDPETGACTTFREGTNHANGLQFGPGGGLYACEVGGRRVARYHPDGTDSTVAAAYDGDRLNSPNDLAFDEDGRLWFTDPRYEENAAGLGREGLDLGHESVYRVDPSDDGWTVHRVADDTTKPNGILVAPDGTRLYVAQTDLDGPTELRSYPIHDDGSLGAHEVLHDFYPHMGTDGMCLDADGNIVATGGSSASGPGPMLYVFAPNGRIMETHPFPGDVLSNVAFGDEDYRTLYVTGDACLFRVRTDRAGYPLPPGRP